MRWSQEAVFSDSPGGKSGHLDLVLLGLGLGPESGPQRRCSSPLLSFKPLELLPHVREGVWLHFMVGDPECDLGKWRNFLCHSDDPAGKAMSEPPRADGSGL